MEKYHCWSYGLPITHWLCTQTNNVHKLKHGRHHQYITKWLVITLSPSPARTGRAPSCNKPSKNKTWLKWDVKTSNCTYLTFALLKQQRSCEKEIITILSLLSLRNVGRKVCTSLPSKIFLKYQCSSAGFFPCHLLVSWKSPLCLVFLAGRLCCFSSYLVLPTSRSVPPFHARPSAKLSRTFSADHNHCSEISRS